MKKMTFYAILMFGSTAYGQVGKIRHKLSQSDLVNYELVGETTRNSYCIPNNSKVLITLSSGKIWVDPWQLNSTGVCASGTRGSVPLASDTVRQRLELKPVASTFGRSIRYMTLNFGAWVYGLSAIPFRVRLKQKIDNSGDQSTSTATSTNFALALYGGHTIRGWSTITNRAIHYNAVSLVAFAGPSTVDISREVGAPTLPIKNKINPTIVYGSGITFSRNAIGATIYLGWESAFGNDAALWIYNGKPFIGFGISTGFMR